MSKKKTTETPVTSETPITSTDTSAAPVSTDAPVAGPVESVASEAAATPEVTPVVSTTDTVTPSVEESKAATPSVPETVSLVFTGHHVETVTVSVGTELKNVRLANANIESMILRNEKGHLISASTKVEEPLKIFTYAKASRG